MSLAFEFITEKCFEQKSVKDDFFVSGDLLPSRLSWMDLAFNGCSFLIVNNENG